MKLIYFGQPCTGRDEGPRNVGGWGTELTESIISLKRSSHRIIRLSKHLRGLSIAEGSRVQHLHPLSWLRIPWLRISHINKRPPESELFNLLCLSFFFSEMGRITESTS